MPPVLQKPRCAEPASWTAMNFWCGLCATCCLLFGTSLVRACLVTTPRLGGSSMMDGETKKSSAGRMGKVIAIALKIGAITNLTSTFLRQPATPHGGKTDPPCFFPISTAGTTQDETVIQEAIHRELHRARLNASKSNASKSNASKSCERTQPQEAYGFSSKLPQPPHTRNESRRDPIRNDADEAGMRGKLHDDFSRFMRGTCDVVDGE